MTLIEIIYNYALEVYHYGREEADISLADVADKKIIPFIQAAVNDDGDLISSDTYDPIFFHYDYKQDIYRPNDSKRSFSNPKNVTH